MFVHPSFDAGRAGPLPERTDPTPVVRRPGAASVRLTRSEATR